MRVADSFSGERLAGRSSPNDSFEAALPVSARTLPHSVEAEQHILSCILIDGGQTLTDCLAYGLREGAFYAEPNRTIFATLCEMQEQGKAVDIAVLVAQLQDAGKLEEVGGAAYLSQLSVVIASSAQARYFTRKLFELHLLRELWRVCTASAAKVFDTPAEDSGALVEQAEEQIFAVSQLRTGHAVAATDMQGHVDKAHAILERMIERRGELLGLSTGLDKLDSLTNGLVPQELLILAARPSMGKTALAVNIAEAVALPRRKEEAKPVLFFSLEMSGPQLALRLICSRSGVSLERVKEGMVGGEERSRMREAEAELKHSPLLIDDASRLTISELRARARRVHSKRPLGLVVIDYLQLLAPRNEKVNREQQVAEFSRGLKALARELNVPVLCLAQLNREADKENRLPRLSDLRESGAIEQDADVVLLLGKGKQDAPKDSAGSDVAGDTAVLIVGKNRNGPVGAVPLHFNRQTTTFRERASSRLEDEPRAAARQEWKRALPAGRFNYE